jgi:hypothetical protein
MHSVLAFYREISSVGVGIDESQNGIDTEFDTDLITDVVAFEIINSRRS